MRRDFSKALKERVLLCDGAMGTMLIAAGAIAGTCPEELNIQETKAAIQGVREGPNLPIICSMTFDKKMHTMMGVSPARAIQTLAPLGVEVIGSNCGTVLRRCSRSLLR